MVSRAYTFDGRAPGIFSFFLIFLGKSFVINIFFVPLHMGLWMRLPSAYLCVKNELSNINYLQVTERLE